MKQNRKKLGNKTPRETMNMEKLSSKDCSVVSSIELNGCQHCKNWIKPANQQRFVNKIMNTRLVEE